jgi:hypothetical protein
MTQYLDGRRKRLRQGLRMINTSLGSTRTPIMRGPKRTSGAGQISAGGGSTKAR